MNPGWKHEVRKIGKYIHKDGEIWGGNLIKW